MQDPPYRSILVALDNSRYSEACSAAAVSLASAFGARVVGCHVYAARMHERRFRQMEAVLPQPYLADLGLEQQRAIHNKLITIGLRLISDSYLDALERRCRAAEVPFDRKTLDGRNWEQLVEDITSSVYDLVVMGARGHGTARPDSVGSVCLRVLRRVRTDVLIVKEPRAFDDGVDGPIMVALDGSRESLGALQVALAVARAYGRPVEAVAAYDPHFHYAVFRGLVEVLSPQAARVFRFKEQERLHAEIIDTGLARLYQGHLDLAQRIARARGASLTTRLLAGRAADVLTSHVERTRPWLALLGRVGVHGSPDLDLGSVTEHLLRFAPCNLLVASRRHSPPMDLLAETAIRWTPEAEAVLARAPAEHRAGLRLLAQRLALEEGHTVITAALAGSLLGSLRPSEEVTRRMQQAAVAVAAEALSRGRGPVYLCPRCTHTARAQRPLECPACQCPGTEFATLDPEALRAFVEASTGVDASEAAGR